MQEAVNTVFQMRFPQKLWYLLNLHTDAILWGGTGRTILLNYRILHCYLQCDNSIFKTTNISSFIRQLNLYGFRKVTSHLQDPLCNSSNPYMHEYIHDYFQFGRPELLKKITRKALPMKKAFKTKNFYTNENVYTPLQRARRALRVALNKAAEDVFMNNIPKIKHSIEFEDGANEFCEDEENIDVDWLLQKNDINKNPNEGPLSKFHFPDLQENLKSIESIPSDTLRDSIQESINFNDDACHQSYQGQLLSMPDLDSITDNENSNAELLAEFNVQKESNVEATVTKAESINHSLNCVLPSVACYNMDDASMTEKNIHDHYHGEWDQMFNDIMINKSNHHEDGSNSKELYSQITLATDLLNS